VVAAKWEVIVGRQERGEKFAAVIELTSVGFFELKKKGKDETKSPGLPK
jgi:hypothetical protein